MADTTTEQQLLPNYIDVPAWIAGLDLSQIEGATRAMLELPPAFTGRDHEPYTYVVRAYDNASVDVRAMIERALLGRVTHLQSIGAPEYGWDAAENLLLAVGGCEVKAATLPLMRIADTWGMPWLQEYRRFHFRVLQTLVTLGPIGSYGFWRTQAARCPEEYLAICYRGNECGHADAAIRLLSEVRAEDTPRLRGDLARITDLMRKWWGAEPVNQAIVRYQLPDWVYEAIAPR